jgi:SAM-dependent methyltransferase
MYDQFASDYDHFVNWKNRLAAEIPFIEKLLQEYQSARRQSLSVLDAACGTGMHALELVRSGFEVVGVDISSEMVAKARSNAITDGLQARFETAAFGSFSDLLGKEKFDALLCLGNSLPHLLTVKDLKAAIEDFGKCLKPGGTLLIQNRNFEAVMSRHDRSMEPQSDEEGNEQWVFQRFYDFNPDGNIRFNVVTLKSRADEPWSSSVLSTLLRPISSDEISKLLTLTGFTKIHTYGNLEGEDFDPVSSSNLVVQARKG